MLAAAARTGRAADEQAARIHFGMIFGSSLLEDRGKTYDDVTAFRVAAAHEERFPCFDQPRRRPAL